MSELHKIRFMNIGFTFKITKKQNNQKNRMNQEKSRETEIMRENKREKREYFKKSGKNLLTNRKIMCIINNVVLRKKVCSLSDVAQRRVLSCKRGVTGRPMRQK